MAEKYVCMRVTQLNATTQPWFEKLDKFTLLTHNLDALELEKSLKTCYIKVFKLKTTF